MAVVVFSKAAGQVQSLPDPTLPANISFRMQGWGGFVGFKSLITQVTVSAKGNYQFLHTLGGQVYVYVFGDRIGQLSVTGLSFDSTCGAPAGLIGIENVLNYYSTFRLANRRVPVKLIIGAATTLEAYLLDINAAMMDPKTRVWQFTMNMSLIPRDEDDPDDSDDDDDADGGDSDVGAGDDTLVDGDVEIDSELGSGTDLTFGPIPSTDGEVDTGGWILEPDDEVVVFSTEAGWSAGKTGPKTSLATPWSVQ